MKNLIVITVMAIMPLLLLAQNSVEIFCQKYKSNENATHLSLSGLSIDLTASLTDDEDTKKVLNKIDKIQVLFSHENNPVDASDFKSLLKDIEKENFEDWMQIREEDTQIRLFVKGNEKEIHQVIVTVFGNDEFILLELNGILSWSDLQNLDLDIEGAEHLKKAPKKIIRA